MKTRSNDAILTFTDICLTLKEKTILTNINGKARSGQILAIMGPTGSGKTSLLNILAGNLTLTSGTITYNGNPFTKLQRRKLAYVLQSDIFLSRLTLRETLYFTAMIRLPDHVTKADKMARIDEIVDALHLRKCLDTVELLTTNNEVVNKILEASEKAKVKVENAELGNGKESTINGDGTSKIAPSLTNGHANEPASNGHVIPLLYHKTDPTEIVLNVSSLKHVSTSNLERPLNTKWAASFWTQFRMLSWRNAKQSKWRIFDECNLIHALIVGSIFCVIYYQIPSSNDTLRDRMGAVFFPLVYWGFAMVTDAVTSFIGEREVVRKERRAGAYRLSAYYTAKMVSELPMMIVVPIAQLSAMYWLAGIGGPVQFAIYLGINLLNCFTTQSIGYIIGACVRTFKYSITAVNTVMVVFLILGGFFNTSFPTWFTWAKYTSFLHYPFAAIVTVLFGDIEPFRCGNPQIFKKCQNEKELITGSDVLHSVGIDLPVYCCVGTMVVLIILLRILGYYAIKYRL
ncbi:uncharacterized protein LOC133192373 [Saccostrea echinata]|uniref:uncharacterized protein LOC133192373 n=1 Tax=Saccostrea echinata TaxID=191078 RepID=UPI002A82EC28|nr:uncharacterized protein LOC133192373 [Saccostrea echinata]